jgi:hypothetical protein
MSIRLATALVEKFAYLLDVALDIVLVKSYLNEPHPQPSNYQQIRGRHIVAFSLRFDHILPPKGLV